MQENTAVSAFAALSLETRLHAVQLLAKTGADGLAAGEIARRLNIPQSTLSDHLGVLTRAGLISSERRSRSIIYRADGQILEELGEFLHQISLQGGNSHKA
ncbi:metalloregulator ArsR/SmtB family transcription factor [Sphingomonas kyeonggiensis]|uniref:DNA-binding transcriptional ArsR family regulator n=1 Tax=Sphingomonas kyeonggiensis TaxID=1268553 RepID=A0A7W6NZB8_9SPHN|nr:DNA-binding transcriptional ArsR family regulator [Sphingomonas kyeonggiensis]